MMAFQIPWKSSTIPLFWWLLPQVCFCLQVNTIFSLSQFFGQLLAFFVGLPLWFAMSTHGLNSSKNFTS
jgi:hypothetical protein